jgi:hypothetical protein
MTLLMNTAQQFSPPVIERPTPPTAAVDELTRVKIFLECVRFAYQALLARGQRAAMSVEPR